MAPKGYKSRSIFVILHEAKKILEESKKGG